MSLTTSRLELNIFPPEGPIVAKYIDGRDNWEFPQIAVMGPQQTGKSHMLVDSLILSAIDYPGANLLLARAKLTDLKRSTIDLMSKRVRLMFERENNHEAVYSLPAQPDPVTGSPAISKIYCIGLDRLDIEDVMKSTNWFRVFLEEGNEMDSLVHDVCMARARQVIYHRTLKMRHLALQNAKRWGVSFQQAQEIMGSSEEGLTKPMLGKNCVKTIFNPRNDHLWQRYVAAAYPEGGIYEDFVEKNLGVREVHRTWEEMQKIRVNFDPGDLVLDSKGQRHFVAKVADDKLEFIPGRYPGGSDYIQGCRLVLQSYAIYTFPWENESRNKPSIKNSLLMVNEGYRLQAFAGADSSREGRVFYNFIPESSDNGGHILKTPKNWRERLNKDYTVLAGIDQGGAHSTAAAFALQTKPSSGFNALIFFAEYLRAGVTARETAYDLLGIPLPKMSVTWGGDPQMFARDFGLDRREDGSIQSHADKYLDAGIDLLPGVKGDAAFDDVNDLFVFRDGFLGEPASARLYVFDRCEDIIEALNTLTWKMVKRQRNLWQVDMGDAIKICIAMRSRAAFNFEGDSVIRHTTMPVMPS